MLHFYADFGTATGPTYDTVIDVTADLVNDKRVVTDDSVLYSLIGIV